MGFITHKALKRTKDIAMDKLDKNICIHGTYFPMREVINKKEKG